MPSQTPGPERGRDAGVWDRGQALYEAYSQAIRLAPGAVYRRTGYALGKVLEGLLPGLLEMLVVLTATTVLGAAVGGVIGFFFGGVGAAPGAVVGGKIGLDVGLAALAWLGLAFLASAILQGFGELWSTLSRGVTRAWNAPERPPREYPHEVTQAAHEMADAVGLLVLLILQALVAWILKRAAMSSTQSAARGLGRARSGETVAASNEAVAAAVAELRRSRMGSGFADWVEQNWPRLRDDPRLRPDLRRDAGTGGAPPSLAPQSSYAGRLGEQRVQLRGVSTRTVQYTKRQRAEYTRLRNEFNKSERKTFLKSLASKPENREALRNAGLTETDLAMISDGRVPQGWQVHHKLPLDDGGTNHFTNLVLIKNVPAHQVLTNAQNFLVGDLIEGQTRAVAFPIPEGVVYPPSPSAVTVLPNRGR